MQVHELYTAYIARAEKCDDLLRDDEELQEYNLEMRVLNVESLQPHVHVVIIVWLSMCAYMYETIPTRVHTYNLVPFLLTIYKPITDIVTECVN